MFQVQNIRGLYLSNIDPKQSVGYMDKIHGQIKGFTQLGFEVDLICFDDQGKIILSQYSNQTVELYFKVTVLGISGKNLFIRRLHLLNKAFQYIKEQKIDFLYLRYPRSEPLYLYFLLRLKKHYPNLLILSEIPTFPYDSEYNNSVSIKDRFVLLLDKITRQYLYKFIDRIISINYDKSIFGIPTISIDNGINVSNYKAISAQYSSNFINLIGVANVSSRHGYDRILYGMQQYYYHTKSNHNYMVKFHIVGGTDPYIQKLYSITQELKLENYVIFHNPCQGQILDKLFDDSHIAIGILGAHRNGLDIMTPLKNREYCARGIPFIFSHNDPDFSNNSKYCLHLSSDDTPVDINRIIDFYRYISQNNTIPEEMRLYANDKLSWSVKLEPVKVYLQQKMRDNKQ